MARSRVDLPHPLGPSSATTPPASMAKPTSHSATVPPKACDTSRTISPPAGSPETCAVAAGPPCAAPTAMSLPSPLSNTRSSALVVTRHW